MVKQQSSVSAAKLAQFDALVATVPDVVRKGATMPYTSHNGHMFSYLSKAGTLALRLPDAPRAAFQKRYKAPLCTQYGVVQKEYVEVPDTLLAKTAELQQYFATSFEYVKAMKPKPTTRKKKTG